MVIIFLSSSIVALKVILEPLLSSSFKVIKLSTLESVKVELLIFLINSLKVIIIFELTITFVSKSAGLNVKIGAALSIIVNIDEAAVVALSNASSTVAPIAT